MKVDETKVLKLDSPTRRLIKLNQQMDERSEKLAALMKPITLEIEREQESRVQNASYLNQPKLSENAINRNKVSAARNRKVLQKGLSVET